MESGLLLNVVVREGSSVLELLSSKDETLLVGCCSMRARLRIERHGGSGEGEEYRQTLATVWEAVRHMQPTNAILVLDLALYVVDGVARLDLEGLKSATCLSRGTAQRSY
jgi:hypothetical protein